LKDSIPAGRNRLFRRNFKPEVIILNILNIPVKKGFA
jgi:hypothetical protein